jgi:hypothetical protein
LRFGLCLNFTCIVRTVIIPDKEVASIPIPKEYIGKEVEIIAFAKDEGFVMDEKPRKKTFTVFNVSAERYKFDRDEANER